MVVDSGSGFCRWNFSTEQQTNRCLENLGSAVWKNGRQEVICSSKAKHAQLLNGTRKVGWMEHKVEGGLECEVTGGCLRK